jgi:hypothetical protein
LAGPGYLEALCEENVNFVSDKIWSIKPHGVELDNGTIVELDALVCATGFNASGPLPFSVIGKNDISLGKRFKPYPSTYLSVAIDGFLNFFMMFGPNSGVGSGSLTTILETEGVYITKCIRKLQKEDYLTTMPKSEHVKDFSERVDEYFKRTVWLCPILLSIWLTLVHRCTWITVRAGIAVIAAKEAGLLLCGRVAPYALLKHSDLRDGKIMSTRIWTGTS